MSVKRWLPVLGTIVLLFFSSCDFFGDDTDDSGALAAGQFWAEDMSGTGIIRKWYKLNAELLAENEYCRVWVEKESGVGKTTAEKVAGAYKNRIYRAMIDTFSFYENVFDYGRPVNAVELASLEAGGDGKLTILLLKIKDGYDKIRNPTYVGGYFWSTNLFSKSYNTYSNECAMIYLDVKVDSPGETKSNETLAHEMQHLINFMTSFVYRSDGETYFDYMDTWVDEGLAAAAEWTYSNNYNESRVYWFNEDDVFGGAKGLASKGNNFFVWGNRETENSNAVMDDYATVYLFFQWLRLQSADGSGIYKKIITSSYPDYRAVIEAMNGSGYTTWEFLLRDWLAANYINAAAGLYGYKDEPTLNKVKAKTFSGSGSSAGLYPGEGVYSTVKSGGGSTPSPENNIRYAGIGNNTVGTATSSGGTLLSFNINTNPKGVRESGVLASISAETAPNTDAARGASPAAMIPFPRQIGAGDLLRRKGHEKDSSFYLTKLFTWKTGRE